MLLETSVSYRLSYSLRSSTELSLSKLSTTHLRTSGKFLSLRFLIKSFTETSENVARIPESILPPTEYL